VDTRILLARHAHTDAIGQRLLGRGPCPGISENGREEAVALAERLAAESIAAVYTSPALRTRQTAELIAEPHALPATELPAFSEVDFGEWTGMAFADLDGDHTWRDFNERRSVTRAPGGELMLEVQARTMAALLDLHSRHAGATIIIVSHADVIRSVIGYVIGVPVDNLLRLAVEPASVSTLLFRGTWPQLTALNRTD
jgi:broad specificity phosphatase PhoE